MRIQQILIFITFVISLQIMANEPLRIMPLGDSITAGYTDNSRWAHPFEYGYRAPLYTLLSDAKIPFKFVGQSAEPMNKKFGDPTHGATVFPKLDLKALGQDGHRGYGGWSIPKIQKNISLWIKEDKPGIILLLIGINGINPKSPQQLEALVKKIYETDKDIKLIVAQITPYSSYKQLLFDYNTFIRQELVPKYQKQGRTILTVDQYKHSLLDPKDPKSIDKKRLSNRINHPTNEIYEKMAQSWFQGIKILLKK
jgi:acyl-CoA thioesterase I